MRATTGRRPTRRRLLGVLAAGSLAGCLGSRSGAEEPTPTATGDGGDGLPTDGGTGAGDTSLAGSCAAAFGDTDRRYDPGERELVATFAYPLAGEIFAESDDDGVSETAIGYGEAERGEFRHRLGVFQRGPVDYDVVESYAGESDWAAGPTVRYAGEDRPVAVLQSDTVAAWVFGVGTYELETRVGANGGEACPDVYRNIVGRVARSFEPAGQ